jgi:hypothetical protein
LAGSVEVRDSDEEWGKALPDVLPIAVAGAGCSCLLSPGAVLCLESPCGIIPNISLLPFKKSRSTALKHLLALTTDIDETTCCCLIS